MPSDPSGLMDAVRDFIEHFELVFDNDWEYTAAALQIPDDFVNNEDTFQNPHVEDEANNWANRGSLLAAYRRLKSLVGDSEYSRASVAD